MDNVDMEGLFLGWKRFRNAKGDEFRAHVSRVIFTYTGAPMLLICDGNAVINWNNVTVMDTGA